MKVLIIGGVAGGASASARLRRLDECAEIVMIERTGYVSYANCGLPYYVGEVIKEERKLTLQTPESFRSRFNVDVRVKQEAIAIDSINKVVTIKRLGDGSEYVESYDELILSPGAKVIRPNVDGIDDSRIFTVRTVEDVLHIREAMRSKCIGTAVVAGGGYIGLETAENLMIEGIDVTIVQRPEQVLAPLDRDMACEVHSYLRNMGLSLELGSSVVGFEHGDKVKTLLADGRSLSSDIVILALGVTPDTGFLDRSGIEMSAKGAIVVDDHMRTSIPNVYAVGDAVVVKNYVTGQNAWIALAGPANKQGRIVADNICGINSSYKGSQGSSIVKLFEMTVATTGLNEKAAKQANVDYDKVYTYSASHATYYPGARNMSIKTLFSPKDGRILGAQIVGYEGVDKRIDVLASAIRAGMTNEDLCELELSYAPPYSSAKDPVNMIGFVIENVRCGLVKQYFCEDVGSIPRDGSVSLIDVRTSKEYSEGHICGYINIPLDELRENVMSMDKGKIAYVCCHSGLRSYIACRILSQNGIECKNLAGGYRFYCAVMGDVKDNSKDAPCGQK